jgi:hypothetical protein
MAGRTNGRLDICRSDKRRSDKRRSHKTRGTMLTAQKMIKVAIKQVLKEVFENRLTV